MTHPAVAALFALFVWWFSTGAIMLAVRWADRRGGRAHLWLTIGALPLLGSGIWAIAMSLGAATQNSIYLGFLGALAVWGWIELAFLAGLITGPIKADCPPGLGRKDRFFRAFGTIAHHELALVAGILGLVLVTNGALNGVALATYLILFLARVFAKLNLFYGVPRINTEFVPVKLHHIKSYFTKGPVTFAFAAAITALTALLVVCAERLWTAQNDVTATGFALLTALSALALLEHWLMVVPLPDAKLWRWMLPAPKSTLEKESKPHGF